MRYRQLAFALASWLLLSGTAHALALGEMLQALDRHYPPLQAARQKLAQAEGKLRQKQGAFDTKIKAKGGGIPLGYYEQVVLDGLVEQNLPLWGLGLYAGYRLGAGEFAVYDGKKATQSLGELRAGVRLPLLRDNAIDENRLGIALAELERERARLSVLEKQLKFIKEASKDYWAWVAAGQKVALATELLELVRRRNQDLEQGVRLGQLPRITLTENQTSLFKRQAKLIETRQKQQQTAWELALFLERLQDGQIRLPPPGVVDFPAPPALNEADLLKPLAAALERRPEPLDVRLQLELNRLNQLWAENQRQPELDLQFGVAQDLGSGDKSRAPFELEAGLGFEWPVQMRKAEGLLQTLAAEQVQLAAELRFSREQIAVEVQALITALLAARERMALTRQQVQVATELEQAERERFKLGATTLLVLNLREQARGEAANEAIEALEAWYKAWSEYLAALGLLQASALALP